MNLYLVLTIALGAVTGVPEAPLTRAALSPAASTVRIQRSAIAAFTVRSLQFAVETHNCKLQTANCEPALATDSPLTGSSTPRAPAQIG